MSAARTPPKVSGLITGAAKPSDRPFRQLPALNERPSAAVEEAKAPQDVGGLPTKVEVRLLDDSPSQYRMIYPVEEIDALASTLKRGQIEAIRIRRKPDGRFEIIAGHRRTRAARSIGLETLDAVIVEVDDLRAAVEVMLANESQEEVGDFERATGYRHLMTMGLNQKAISDEIGVGKSLVSMRLKFFDLPEVVLAQLKVYPRAYSHRAIPELLDILKSSPELANDVAEGTKKVGTGEWSSQTLISVLRQKQSRQAGPAKANEKLAISDRQSRPILTMTPRPKNKVEIQLSPNVDQAAFVKLLTDLLRVEAEKDVSPFEVKE